MSRGRGRVTPRVRHGRRAVQLHARGGQGKKRGKQATGVHRPTVCVWGAQLHFFRGAAGGGGAVEAGGGCAEARGCHSRCVLRRPGPARGFSGPNANLRQCTPSSWDGPTAAAGPPLRVPDPPCAGCRVYDSDVTAAGFVRDGAPVLVRWRAFPMPRSSVIEEEK